MFTFELEFKVEKNPPEQPEHPIERADVSFIDKLMNKELDDIKALAPRLILLNSQDLNSREKNGVFASIMSCDAKLLKEMPSKKSEIPTLSEILNP